MNKLEKKAIKENLNFFKKSPEKIFEPETMKHLDLVKEINKLGFITDDSQDGKIIIGDVPKDVPEYVSIKAKLFKKYVIPVEEKEYNNDEDYEKERKKAVKIINNQVEKIYKKGYKKGLKESQRAYITGYMRKDLAYVFDYFLNQTDKVSITGDNKDINLTYQMTFSLYDPNFALPKFQKKFLKSYVQAPTHIPLRHLDSMFYLENLIGKPNIHSYKEIKENNNKSYLSKYFTKVICFDPRHGRKASSKNGLFSDIIRILKQSRTIINI